MNDDHEQVPWQQNLRAMWFAELVAIIGFAVVLPLLPLYVKDLGVEGERQARIWSGLIFSAHSVTMAIFGPIWGSLSDRYGRKVMVERAMFGGAVMMTLMGFAQSPLQLTILRAIQGALTGTVAAATTLVATSAPKERKGYALGTLQMAIYFGASVGPLLGGVVADTLGFRAAFYITGGLLLTAGVAVLIFVKEPSREEPLINPAKKTGEKMTLLERVWGYLSPALASGPILGVLVVRLLLMLGSRLPRPTLPLFVEAISSPGARVATITGVITGAGALGGAVGGRELGKLSDRVGYRKILISCALLSIVCYTGQSLVERSLWLAPFQIGIGLAMGGILASVRALLADLAPEGREGVVYGVENSVSSVANAIGPMTGSALAAAIGLRAPFLAASLVFGGAVLAILKLLPRD
ncbi:MAG: MFS transporter [Anaerolineales bacterium]|nr:MFS transporter [Anaerolineales bacterium]MBS3752891.1 MFS transporter [Anaerolineales bacterium]